MSDYSYDDYLESGEVTNPVAVEAAPDYTDCSNDVNPETSEYAGNEYTEFNKDIAKNTGVDLNSDTSDVKNEAGKISEKTNVGVDLNDCGGDKIDSILDNFQ